MHVRVHMCMCVHACVSERGHIHMSAGALGEQRCWILLKLSLSGPEKPRVVAGIHTWVLLTSEPSPHPQTIASLRRFLRWLMHVKAETGGSL